VKKYIGEQTFMFTNSDRVVNVNIKALLDFHIKNNRMATVCAVHPFGLL